MLLRFQCTYKKLMSCKLMDLSIDIKVENVFGIIGLHCNSCKAINICDVFVEVIDEMAGKNIENNVSE